MSDEKKRFNPKPLIKDEGDEKSERKSQGRSFDQKKTIRRKKSGRGEAPQRNRTSSRDQKPTRSTTTSRDQKPVRGEKKKRPSSSGVSRNAMRSGQNRAKNTLKNPDKASQRQVIDKEMRINKYIAHAGLCSRREADEYVEAGRVKVNGKKVTEVGTKILKTDTVEVDGQSIQLEPFVYILLNKRSGTITTTDDEKSRETVMDTIEDATGLRVYPVGRLDRSTTGIIVLTNDGDLAHRLMHPSYTVKKTYQVTPNRTLTDEEMQKLMDGVNLEDGFIKPEYVQRDKMNPGKIFIVVHEGRNHLIRRMIEHIGATVEKLKRVQYAGLIDKDLKEGRWRYLRQNEINSLRNLVKLETLDFNKGQS